MPMLAASDPVFKGLYPFGAIVMDNRGRQITDVFACNPVTGEVIRFDWRPSLWSRFVSGSVTLRRYDWWRWMFRSGLPTRHGFWPAPLTVTSIEKKDGLSWNKTM
jgi:hypothetical protein